MKMRKLTLSIGYVAAIIAAIFLLLPFLFGIITQNRCNQLIANINATTPITTKILKYRRGWFEAKATAVIDLSNIKLPNQSLQQLTINARINHGPVFMDWIRFHFAQAILKADITLSEEQNSLLKIDSSINPVANIKIKFRLSGDTTILVDSPRFNYQDEENIINWEGLNIKSNFSHLNHQTQSTIEFNGANLNLNKHELNIGKLICIFKGNKTKFGLWAGERKIHLYSFTSKNPNDHIIDLKNVDLNFLMLENDRNYIDIKTIIDIGDMTLNDGVYNKNKIELELNHLNQQALANLQNQLIISKLSPDSPGVGISDIVPILSNGAQVKNLSLTTTTPWGKLLSELQINFADQPKNPGVFSTLINSDIKSDIKIEQLLLTHLLEKFYQLIPIKHEGDDPHQQAELLINRWIENGRINISPDSPYLSIIFNYKDGQFSINNQNITLTIT